MRLRIQRTRLGPHCLDEVSEEEQETGTNNHKYYKQSFTIIYAQPFMPNRNVNKLYLVDTTRLLRDRF